MPRDLSISHWSRPRALRTLLALWRLGGAATTWQIAEQTRSMAVHSDVDHLRCLCQAERLCPAEDAVTQAYARTTCTGARVSVYTLSEPVRSALRSGHFQRQFDELAEGDQSRLQRAKERRSAEHQARRAAGAARPARTVQQVLVDMAPRTPEEAQRRRR